MRKLVNKELARKTLPEFIAAEKNPVVIALDNVRSSYNIGSVFRTADAFLVEAIYLCGITACPPNKEIEKTALGATASVSWKYFKSTIEAVKNLKEAGYKIYAVEQAESSILLNNFNYDKNEKLALVFGNEIKGVGEETLAQCDGVIEIPQFGTKHSFNISVCAGIVLWEALN